MTDGLTVRISVLTTNEGTFPSVSVIFEWNIYQFVGFKETKRSAKEFVPIRCPSPVITVLLNFRALATDLGKS